MAGDKNTRFVAVVAADTAVDPCQGAPHLLVVGKASGLAHEALDAADIRLEPIDGGTDYRHLSVRSAMAILLDRLLRP